MTARAARPSVPGAPQGQRHRAREAAVQMLYQWEVGRLSMAEVRQTFWSHDDEAGHPLSADMRTFAMRLADGVVSTVDQLDPMIAAAEDALERQSVDALIDMTTVDVGQEIRRRFVRAIELKHSAGGNVEAGRAFVAAYEEFMHAVEALRQGGTAERAGEVAVSTRRR